jgi:integral membrane sensor domain MASE1
MIGFLVFQRVMNFTLFLVAFLFVMLLSDARKSKMMPEQLSFQDLSKIMWPTWILGGVVGFVLIIFTSAVSNLELSSSILLIGVLGGLLTWVRTISLKVRSQISNSDAVSIILIGVVIAALLTAAFTYIFIIVGMMTGFLAQ